MDKNLDLVRKCLTLISRIAARGAAAPDPEYVSDILFQLSYALETYPYSSRAFEPPVSPKSIYQLHKLHQELDEIDLTCTGYTARDFLRFVNTSTWN
jgi:hypothetical protein